MVRRRKRGEWQRCGAEFKRSIGLSWSWEERFGREESAFHWRKRDVSLWVPGFQRILGNGL